MEWLGSWVDGAAKREILSFVEASSDPYSGAFIPELDRVATFDNDGTLWVEKPVPVMAPLLVDKLVERVKADPSLASRQPYAAIINEDPEFFEGIARQVPEVVMEFIKGIGEAWEGASPESYADEVTAYLETSRNERFGRPHTDLVYRPMMELLDLLRGHGWRVFICSGGGRDFMHVFCEEMWGVPRENIIGSAADWTFEHGRLRRANAMRGRLALGAGKPEAIFARTGRLPRFAAGNGDVDIEMLEVADFGLVVVHDDPDREHAYTDGAERLMPVSKSAGWTLVSIANDWNTVFDWESSKRAQEGPA